MITIISMTSTQTAYANVSFKPDLQLQDSPRFFAELSSIPHLHYSYMSPKENPTLKGLGHKIELKYLDKNN